MQRIVIDTDPGIDDAHAILLAWAYPAVKIEALTTVAGNVSLERATANALFIRGLLGAEMPVFAGCADALVVPTPRRAVSHGRDGLGDSHFPPAAGAPAAGHAAQALIRLADESPGELILVALGPLTNVALATRLDPGLPGKYRRLVVMGGAIQGMGNAWTPAAEFNMYVDPEAASIVLDSWPGLTLVSWETTLKHGLADEEIEALRAIDSPRAEFFRRTIAGRVSTLPTGERRLYEPDPLAMAVALEPGLVRQAEARYVQVELAGALTRGQTVVDWFDVTGRAPNAELVLEVDQERFVKLLRNGLI
jgi:purine nucleosidase